MATTPTAEEKALKIKNLLHSYYVDQNDQLSEAGADLAQPS